MELIFKKGSSEYLNACEEALQRSELGNQYFSSEGSARNAVIEGLESDTMTVVLVRKDSILEEGIRILENDQISCDNSENLECVGFSYYIKKGAFHAFPYLHLIAVKDECRGKGVGKALLDHTENEIFEFCDKLFLVVADFNPDAKRFYERCGYQKVGELPSLYRPGIHEYLMLKTKN